MKPLISLKLPALLCLALSLVACGGEQSTTETTTNQQKAEVFKSKLPDNAPTVKVVTTGVQPPFSFLDSYGNLQGVDIDLIRAIGEDQGFKVELYTQRFDKAFLGLENKTYQIAISNMSYSPERASKYGHSIGYLSNAPAIMFNPKLNIKGLNDLRGLRIATMYGTTHSNVINSIAGTKKSDNLSSVFLLYKSLLQDKYDAILNDQLILEYHATNHPEYKVKVIPYVPITDPRAQLVIYTQKNDVALVKKLNQGIEHLKANGTIEKIKSKYIKSSE